MTNVFTVDLEDDVPMKGKAPTVAEQAAYLSGKLPAHCKVVGKGGEVFVFADDTELEALTSHLDDAGVRCYVYEADEAVMAAAGVTSLEVIDNNRIVMSQPYLGVSDVGSPSVHVVTNRDAVTVEIDGKIAGRLVFSDLVFFMIAEGALTEK